MPLRRKIVMLTGNHLCHNPRVIKEAAALDEAGYEVEVFGGWFDAELKRRDVEVAAALEINFTPVINLAEGNDAGRFYSRLRNKLGRLAHATLGWENSWQLGYSAGALGRAALRSSADLFIAHSEPALWSISKLSTPMSRLGVDMEDWFSEDLLPEAKRQRPVKMLRALEKRLLNNAVHASCPSVAMSKALAEEYGCPRPSVIYNAFLWRDRDSLDKQFKDRRNLRIPSIHWYSQTIGQGRGLEDLLAALKLLKHDAEIHLRGNPVKGFGNWLDARVPQEWRKRVHVHSLVSNEELLSRISEHDIGFAGEMKYCRSRDLTVTNKMLHYLLGGLAVVASDTAGQREVAEKASGGVLIYKSGDSPALADRLNTLLQSESQLRSAKAAALAAAKREFCWERQVPALLQSIEITKAN